MLHIILGILKIVGIIILVILGIVLLLVCCILFVPVRYQITAAKTEEGGKLFRTDQLKAHARISWLLGLITVRGGYEETSAVFSVKIFGFTLIGDKKETKKKSSDRQKKSSKKKKPNEPTKEPTVKELPQHTGKRDEQYIEPEKTAEQNKNLPKQNGKQNDLQHEAHTGHAGSQPIEVLQPDDHDETVKFRDAEKNKHIQPKKRIKERISTIIDRYVSVLRCLLEFILSIPIKTGTFLEKFFDAVNCGQDAVYFVSDKIDEVQKKINPYLTDSSKALYKRVLSRIRYLLKHYKPRSCRGMLRYGVGSPDLTGKITGLLYLALSGYDELSIEPDFNESCLSADIRLKGRIRACHIVKILIDMLLDKEFRNMLKQIRSKGGNKNG